MNQLKRNAKKVMDEAVTQFITKLNALFNDQPLRTRMHIVMAGSLFISLVCGTILLRALITPPNASLSTGTIVQPHLLPLRAKQTESLIPLGVMKGVIDEAVGEYYVAMDTAGTLYVRGDWTDEGMFEKSPQWKVITQEKFNEIKKGQRVATPHANGAAIRK